MGWLGSPTPVNRSEAQKRANEEKMARLKKAKRQAAEQEEKLRRQLREIERKAGSGKRADKLSRAERKMLKDNGMWSKVHEQSYTKGAPRW